MTTEFIKILSDFVSLIKDWNFRLVPKEEEFITRLKDLNARLTEELPKQKVPTIQEE